MDFTGPNGITRGMTPEEARELLGEPFFPSGDFAEDSGVTDLYYMTDRGEALCLLFLEDTGLAGFFYQDFAKLYGDDLIFHN